jgi:hypothetical protein
MRQLKRALKPFLKSIRVDWGDIVPSIYIQTPSIPNSIIKGDSITTFALLKYDKVKELEDKNITISWENASGATSSVKLKLGEEREGDIIGIS